MALSRIAQNIRSLRIAQGMTVDKLAVKSGFSKGFISQVENFRVSPSLKALNRIADALGIDIHVLFQDETQTPEYTFGSLDSGEEVSRDNGGHFGIIYHALAYRQIGRNMDPFMIEYHPSSEERDFMIHDTEEFYVLLEGELEFFIADEKNSTAMKAGDTLYMKANLPH
jgi:transcriptional regulator with XRE-family HTH domain